MAFSDALHELIANLRSTGVLYALPIFYLATIAIYRMYFHELAKYPGPFLARFTSWPKMAAMVRTDRVLWQQKMLAKYGDPVRISYDELLFGNMKSWHDIYGQGSMICAKEPKFYDMFSATGAKSLLNETDRLRHARLRRLVSHGFSKRALLQDESVIQNRIEIFIKTIVDPAAKATTSVDIYDPIMGHFLDIVSHLSFGKSFDSVSGNGSITYKEVDRL